jgi:hypothetical protein
VSWPRAEAAAQTLPSSEKWKGLKSFMSCTGRTTTTTASVPVLPVRRRAAFSSTWYFSLAAAAATRARVASLTTGSPASARLTVDWLTPASAATSKLVTR